MNFKHGMLTHLRPRRLATVFGVLTQLVLGLPLHAQTLTPGNPTLLRAINAVRDQGCGSGPMRSPRLRENAALSQAAVMISGGARLDDAIRTAGYRPVRAAQITVGGITGAGALTSRVLGKSCAAVMPSHFQEAGFHQLGNRTWVVLAEPFVAPQAIEGNQVEARILALVNAARAQPRRCGNQSFSAAPPLLLQPRLTEVAAPHAADMSRHGYFSHTGRDGSTVGDRASRVGYPWRNIGENIAAGQMTADLAVQGWLKSPDHCANIMAPEFRDMGVAFEANPQSRWGIYWVQVFGSTR